jgi:HPt (histidine-containing phosphotransfer) domain-containing protein
MTVQEFYNEVGGDYDEIMSRLRTEERISKFAGMFTKDESFKTLVSSLESGNAQEAFRAAHTMKGMCQNMAFTRLYKSSNEITETLRPQNQEAIDKAKEQINTVTEDYNLVINGIHKLLS